jgi:uncharacterized delta-60 repeat protein
VVGALFAAAAQAAPGDLDPTFSGDGKQTTNFGQSNNVASGVAIYPNGKVVAAGSTGPNQSGCCIVGGDFALARYNPNGLLDPTFSGDGKQTTNFGGDPENGGDGAGAVALDPNGKIVVVGRGGPGADFALARYNPTGSLDPNFSGDGKQTTNFGFTDDVATSVAIQPNGKIVVAGYNGLTFALARYNSNGSLDPSFSGDGKQTTNFGSGAVASGVAIQPNGKIVVVGRGGPGADFAIARYNPNGSLDPTFSGDGKQTTNFGGYDGANGVALQGNGKIVAVGFALGGDNDQLATDFGLARYNPNGLLDATFSGDGKQTTDFGGESDGASGVAIQPNGKIVAAGCACPGTVNPPREFALARYNPSGSLDPSFSGDGRVTTGFGGFDDRANGVALQADGKIVAVGRGVPGGDFALARYLGG